MRQKDITRLIEATDSSEEVAQLTEAALSLLELIYPRHIIEQLAAEATKAVRLQQSAAEACVSSAPLPPLPPPPGTCGVDPGGGIQRVPPAPPIFNISVLSDLATQHEQVTILFTDIVGWVFGPCPRPCPRP